MPSMHSNSFLQCEPSFHSTALVTSLGNVNFLVRQAKDITADLFPDGGPPTVRMCEALQKLAACGAGDQRQDGVGRVAVTFGLGHLKSAGGCLHCKSSRVLVRVA
eukprot:1161525-Pelagomonas_calceolata.AAC.1